MSGGGEKIQKCSMKLQLKPHKAKSKEKIPIPVPMYLNHTNTYTCTRGVQYDRQTSILFCFESTNYQISSYICKYQWMFCWLLSFFKHVTFAKSIVHPNFIICFSHKVIEYENPAQDGPH